MKTSMKTRWLKLSIFVAFLFFSTYIGLKIRSSTIKAVKAQGLSLAPPIGDVLMAPASSPKTPFRLVWQHVGLKNATISPDWKFLAQTQGDAKNESTNIVSTQSGRFVRRVPGRLFPKKAPQFPSGTAGLHPNIREVIFKNDKMEARSSRAQLVVVRDTVYDMRNGRQLWNLKTLGFGPKVFLGFSPNGKWMLTRESDKLGENEKHFLRDARTGKILRRFSWKSSPYDAPLGFSPDSRQFGVFDRGVKFYAMPSGKPTFRYDGWTYGAGALEFSGDAQSLVTADGGDETVAVWNTKTGHTTRFWNALNNAAGALAMSPDGKFLASGSNGDCGTDFVRVWNFASAKELWVESSGYNSYGVSDVKWSPDGTLLASAGGGPPQIWNAKNGKRSAVLGGKAHGKGRVTAYTDRSNERSEPSLFWSSDARELWVGGKDGIKIWSRDGEFLREIKTVPKIASMARCPSGQRVVIGTGDGEIVLLHIKNGEISWRKKIGKDAVSVAFLPSDRVVSWSSWRAKGNQILVWDAKGGFTKQTLDAPLGIYKVVVSRAGKRIASIGNGIMLWETAPENNKSK